MLLPFSVIILSCEDHDLFMLILVTGVLCPLLKSFSSYQVFASLLNRSATRIGSFLFPFLNGVLSTLFISVAFFLAFCSTFARFFGFTRLSKEAT